jgi:hypothetical protein
VSGTGLTTGGAGVVVVVVVTVVGVIVVVVVVVPAVVENTTTPGAFGFEVGNGTKGRGLTVPGVFLVFLTTNPMVARSSKTEMALYEANNMYILEKK